MANTFETTIDLTDAAIASNAGFRTWVQAVEAALLASGFLEVAPDTGQIDPATVLAPTVTNGDAGYRIYRAKDALAATRPLYLKLIFGTGNTVGRPRINRSLGTGSNGAGTLTGLTSTVVTTTATAVGSSVVRIFGGGGPSCAFLVQADGSLTQHMTMAVGRAVDPTLGTSVDQMSWFIAGFSGAYSVTHCSFTDHSAGWATWDPSNCFIGINAPPNSGGSAAKIRAFKGYMYRNGEVYDLPFLMARTADFPLASGSADNSKFTADAWGAPHTWLPGNGTPSIGTGGGTVVMRWE